MKGEHPIMYYSDYNRPPEEGQPIETNNFRVSDPEPPRKKKGGAANAPRRNLFNQIRNPLVRCLRRQ